MVLSVFVIALLAATAMGILQINAEESQLMHNHVGMVEAQAIAEAGLHRALAQLRRAPDWDRGYADEAFAGGRYTVTRNGWLVTATGRTGLGYETQVIANVRVDPSGPPHRVHVDTFTVNP